MSNPADLSHLSRLAALLRSAQAAPPGAGRIATAVATGLVCHALFGLAVLAMIGAMFFGMSESFGRVPWPWAIVANT
ncbi:MAG: isoprenylcysteine carboxylmethyltransferase family protein, partial [Bradyrhizobiaceae bacterium]